MKRLSLLIAILVTCSVTACGGGEPVALTTQAYLDLNGNAQQDPEEPAAAVDANGPLNLRVDASNLQQATTTLVIAGSTIPVSLSPPAEQAVVAAPLPISSEIQWTTFSIIPMDVGAVSASPGGSLSLVSSGSSPIYGTLGLNSGTVTTGAIVVTSTAPAITLKPTVVQRP